MNIARATFRSTSWEETEWAPCEGSPKLTRAVCSQAYTGDIEGESVLEYLMSYGADGAAEFVGIERIVGSLAGRRGAFVLRHHGRFAGGVATMTLVVVEGAGSGELAALVGRAAFESAHAAEYPIELEYEFAGE